MSGKTSYPGIDYSLGLGPNVDKATGIHYGVIALNSLGEDAFDSFESEYGEPHCPKCGNEVDPIPDDQLAEIEGYERAKYECEDFVCLACEYVFGGESAYPDEAIGFSYSDSEYDLADCLQSDVFVFRSPYYTYAQYCSPCVPGAGNLDNPCDDGPKTYCLGHEWFDEGKAPYMVYRVSDGSIVEPEQEVMLMREGSAVTYEVFVRDWWAYDKTSTFYVDDNGRATTQQPAYPVCPYPGAPRRRIARRCTEEEARAIAQEYNQTHKPGWRSRKAEYTQE